LSNQLKQALQYLIIFAIGGLFIYLVFKGTDWEDLWLKLKNTNYFWISVGMLVSLLSHVIRAYRATLLYDAMGYRISTTNSYHAVIIGYFMNYVIPRGGEVSRCASLMKTNQLPVEKGLGTVITERLVDLVILTLILGLVFILQFDVLYNYITSNANGSEAASSDWSMKLYVILALLAMGVFVFAFRNRLMQIGLVAKFFDKIKGFGQGLASIRFVKQPVLFIVLSLAIWACYILMMYFCLFAMESTAGLNFVQCLTVFAMGTIGVVIPAPGAGAGTYHFAVMQGLLLFGVDGADGKAYATIVHGAQMILFIILGIISSIFVLVQQKNKTTTP